MKKELRCKGQKIGVNPIDKMMEKRRNGEKNCRDRKPKVDVRDGA